MRRSSNSKKGGIVPLSRVEYRIVSCSENRLIAEADVKVEDEAEVEDEVEYEDEEEAEYQAMLNREFVEVVVGKVTVWVEQLSPHEWFIVRFDENLKVADAFEKIQAFLSKQRKRF